MMMKASRSSNGNDAATGHGSLTVSARAHAPRAPLAILLLHIPGRLVYIVTRALPTLTHLCRLQYCRRGPSHVPGRDAVVVVTTSLRSLKCPHHRPLVAPKAGASQAVALKTEAL